MLDRSNLREGLFWPWFEDTVHPGGKAWQEAVGLQFVLCQQEAACYIVFPSQEAELTGARLAFSFLFSLWL